MTPTDDLFLLIKSLNGSEKRYFKIWAGKHVIDQKNKYELLFDAFDNLPEDQPYHESDFKKNLHQAQLVKHFADEKKNLLELITKAMRAYHAEKTIDHEINNLLADENFFRLKRLNTLRKKAIDKAKKLAERYERIPALLTLIEREVNMQIEWHPSELKELTAKLDTEEQQALNRLQTLASLRYFSNRLFVQVRISTVQSSPELQNESTRLINEPMVKNYRPGNSFAADRHYYRIYAMHHRIHRNMAEHEHYSRLIYELYEIHHPNQKENNTSSYKISLFNYLNASFAAGNLKHFPQLLEKARQIPAASRDEEGEDWQNLIHLELIYLSNTGQLTKAVAMATDIENGLKRYKHKVNKARELALYYNLAASFFVSANWSSALDYYNKIVLDKSDARQDLKVAAELLILASQYELKNYDVTEYLLRNTERRFSTIGKKDTYKLFFKYLRQLIKNDKPIINEEEEEVSLTASLARHAELLCWIQAKQQKKKIEDIFRKTILAPL